MPGTPASSRAAAGDLALLASSVLAADAASIDLTGLDQTYEHLQVIMYARGTQAVATTFVFWQFNGDAGANYDRQTVRGINVTASATAAAGGTSFSFLVPGATAAANSFGGGEMLLPAYARTVGHKVAIFSHGMGDATLASQLAALEVCRWRNTAAITQITLLANVGNLLAGSGVWIYGLN